MKTHKAALTVEQDGVVTIEEAPVKAGDHVEVMLLITEGEPAQEHDTRYPLRGKQPYRFDDPFSPVAEDDWEALK